MAGAEDLGNYYRIPADNRDLNYTKYFAKGSLKVSTFDDYNSHNTRLLNFQETKELLMNLDYVIDELKNFK